MFRLTYCGMPYVQSELRMRLIKLNWQKSMCSRVKAIDEQAKNDAKVVCSKGHVMSAHSVCFCAAF